MKTNKLFIASMAMVLIGFSSLKAQTIIASYPLNTDVADSTGNYGNISLTGISAPSGEICNNGTYANYAQTPNISTLNQGQFEIDVDFNISSFPSNPNEPIIVGGPAYRWIGAFIDPTGKMELLYNDGSFITSSKTVVLNTWNTVQIQYNNNHVRMLLNDTIVVDDCIGGLTTGNDLSFLTSNFSQGTSLNGCIRNFRIINSPIVPLTQITNNDTICSNDSVIVGIHTYKLTGTYIDTVASGSCYNRIITNLTVNPLPTATVTGKLAICSGTMDTLTANATGNSPFTYSWSTSGTNDTIQVSSANTYSVTVSDVNGCTNTAAATVTVNSLPTVTVNSPTICSGTSATLTGGGISTFSWNPYSWSTGSTFDTTNVSPTTTTSYTLTGTDQSGCSNSAVATVTVNPIPTITVTGRAAICVGSFDRLKANVNGNAPFTYAWSTSGTNDTTYVSAANTYSVTVTDSNGCTNAATKSVIVNPLPTVSITGLTPICAGTMDTLIANASGNAPFTYHWTPGFSAHDSLVVLTTNSKTYTVTVTDSNGCRSKDSLAVVVNPLPILSITGMDSIVSGTKDTLVASGANSYVWTAGSSMDTNIVSPTTTTTYTVKGTNSFGCSAIDSFTVVIKITAGIATLTENNSTTLYPNPAITTMSLTFDMQGTATDAIISVLNVTGKSMLESTTQISNRKTLPVDISSLPAGIYFVRITTAKTSQTIKFVKENR